MYQAVSLHSVEAVFAGRSACGEIRERHEDSHPGRASERFGRFVQCFGGRVRVCRTVDGDVDLHGGTAAVGDTYGLVCVGRKQGRGFVRQCERDAGRVADEQHDEDSDVGRGSFHSERFERIVVSDEDSGSGRGCFHGARSGWRGGAVREALKMRKIIAVVATALLAVSTVFGQTARTVMMGSPGQSDAYRLQSRDHIVRSNMLAVAAGDLSGTASSSTVKGLQGKAIPAPGVGDTGKGYVWNGSAWVLQTASVVANWGAILGTLSNQTDLWAQLTNRYTKAETLGLFPGASVAYATVAGYATNAGYATTAGALAGGELDPTVTNRVRQSVTLAPGGSAGMVLSRDATTNKWVAFSSDGITQGMPNVTLGTNFDTADKTLRGEWLMLSGTISSTNSLVNLWNLQGQVKVSSVLAPLPVSGRYLQVDGLGYNQWVDLTYVPTAGTSDYANVSGYADTAGTSVYANASGYSVTAGTSDYANVAGSADVSGYATNALYADVAGLATNALYADVSGYATNALYADVSGYATNALTAGYASTAGTSDYAIVSGGMRDSSLVTSANGDTRQLFDNSGMMSSMDWNSRIAQDAVAMTAIDWANRYLYAADGIVISLDWANRTSHDLAGLAAFDWANRLTYSSDGTTPTIDWLNGRLTNLEWSVSNIADADYEIVNWQSMTGFVGSASVSYAATAGTSDYANVAGSAYSLYSLEPVLVVSGDALQMYAKDSSVRVDWGLGLLNDAGAFQSMDWINRSLSDAAATVAMNWASRYLYDTGGTAISVDWANRYLYDVSGTVLSMDWATRAAYDSAAAQAFDWNSRTLIDTMGMSPVLDWANRITYGSEGNPSINWGTRLGVDAASATSIDWNLRYAYDTGGSIVSLDWASRLGKDAADVTSFDWAGRYLYNSSSVLMYDWGLGQMNDSAAGISLSSDTRALYDAMGGAAAYWGLRQLTDSAAQLSIDWDSGILYSGGTISLSYANTALTNFLWTYGLMAAGADPYEIVNFACMTGFVANASVSYASTAGTSTWATAAGYADNAYFLYNTNTSVISANGSAMTLLYDGASVSLEWVNGWLTNLEWKVSNIADADDEIVNWQSMTGFVSGASVSYAAAASNAYFLYDVENSYATADGAGMVLYASSGTQTSLNWDVRELFRNDGSTDITVLNWNVTSLWGNWLLYDADFSDTNSVVNVRYVADVTNALFASVTNWAAGQGYLTNGMSELIVGDPAVNAFYASPTNFGFLNGGAPDGMWDYIAKTFSSGSSWLFNVNGLDMYAQSVNIESGTFMVTNNGFRVIDVASAVGSLSSPADGTQALDWFGRALYAANGTDITVAWDTRELQGTAWTVTGELYVDSTLHAEGGATVSNGLFMAEGSDVYLHGTENVNESWRLHHDAATSNMVMQVRVSDTWVDSVVFTRP